MSNFANLLGPLNLWASLPSFLLYYLFYSSFEHSDPEGPVKDTKVKTLKKKTFEFHFARRYRFFWLVIISKNAAIAVQTNWLFKLYFIYLFFFFLLKELVESR